MAKCRCFRRKLRADRSSWRASFDIAPHSHMAGPNSVGQFCSILLARTMASTGLFDPRWSTRTNCSAFCLRHTSPIALYKGSLVSLHHPTTTMTENVRIMPMINKNKLRRPKSQLKQVISNPNALQLIVTQLNNKSLWVRRLFM